MQGLVVQFYRGMEPMVQEKENVLRQSSWRGGELPPVPDGGPAVEVARVCDKSRHVPASL